MGCNVNGEQGFLQEPFIEDQLCYCTHFTTPDQDCFFLPDDICYVPFREQEISPPEFDGDFYNLGLDPYSFGDCLSAAVLHDSGVSVHALESPPDVSPSAGPQNDKHKKSKRVNGQPSKNLMAERRRRRRLNDRLSMLRSVVPKISKMDRTSILGDTISYVKELMQKISCLREEMEAMSDQVNHRNIGLFKHEKPSEILIRNSPKFDVERRNSETRIEICCGGRDGHGLLLSTVTTLEGLGLEIQHCVASCFNDFALQASCLEPGFNEMTTLGSEDIKQQLLRSAGYGGKRCP